MSFVRFQENPLIQPADVKPSREDFTVLCAFNAGVTRVGDEVVMLLRVAESVPQRADRRVAPFLHPDELARGIELLDVSADDPHINPDASDSRVFVYRDQIYLTSISHLRVARSKDGRHFTVDEKPALFPARREEEFGIEDPRITRIGEDYYINYTAVSRDGIATALAVTRDFKTFERKGIIFAPENRDVTIFPEKVGGRYACFHRPVTSGFGGPDIWFARSPDLIHWGEHVRVCGPRSGMWDAWKIGGGAVPIRTQRGWLSIYHGADDDERYALGLLLTDLDEPWRIIARSAGPVMVPEADYEMNGFFGNVLFTCGALAEPDGKVTLYYGAADERMAGAEATIDELLATLV